MVRKLINTKRPYFIESIILLIVYTFNWIGFGDYTSVILLLAFLVTLFFKDKRELIFSDKYILILTILFTLSCIISSLFSINKLNSTLISLLWFFVIFVPISYVRFSLNSENDFFIKYIIPVSFLMVFAILLQLYFHFFYNLFTKGLIIKRYTAKFLGKASTPDMLVMLGGIGYGWIRQKESEKHKWYGFIFLLGCFFGSVLTFDRGGVVSFFILMIILLSFDYKRLIFLSIITIIAIYLTFKLSTLHRFEHLFDFLYSKRTQKSLTTAAQIATFKGAWGMIKDHWFLGVGTNNFARHIKNYGVGKWYTYAHNFILQFWAENGLFGMIFGLSIIGLTIYRWIKSWKQYKYKWIALGLGASFICMLVGNLTNSTIWILKVALPFWLLAGSINAIYFIVRNQKLQILQLKNKQII